MPRAVAYRRVLRTGLSSENSLRRYGLASRAFAKSSYSSPVGASKSTSGPLPREIQLPSQSVLSSKPISKAAVPPKGDGSPSPSQTRTFHRHRVPDRSTSPSYSTPTELFDPTLPLSQRRFSSDSRSSSLRATRMR